MKSPGILLVPIELESVRKPAAEGTQTFEELVAAGLPGHGERLFIEHRQFDIVTVLQIEGFDDSGGKTDGEAVAPFCNPHVRLLPPYTCMAMYILHLTGSRERSPPASRMFLSMAGRRAPRGSTRATAPGAHSAANNCRQRRDSQR